MRISTVTQAYKTEIRRIEASKKDPKSAKAKSAAKDSSSISPASRSLSDVQHNMDVARAQVTAQPEIRQEKITEVLEKMKNHYYDSAEFVDQLAEKILKDFGLPAGSE